MLQRIHSTLFLCRNIQKTVRFYEKIGFDIELSGDTARILFGDYRLAFMEEGKVTIKDDPIAKKGIGMYLYFEVEDVDLFFQGLKEKGIITSSEPTTWSWGKREFAVKDPDGYRLIFFTNVKDFEPKS